MFKKNRLIGKYIALHFMFMPIVCYAGNNEEIGMELGRTGLLLDKASEGISKLSKSKVTSKWSGQAQDKAIDICAFVEKKLKRSHLIRKDAQFCSVE
ncbi:hypothetical protein ACNHKD_04440 [Methylocystis sp. JAN1]|uniref:hypothetical protein n=1 Tax=Methylocystis sp. JAN1 TaxID=3397211 RepID=UPI003FA23268